MQDYLSFDLTCTCMMFYLLFCSVNNDRREEEERGGAGGLNDLLNPFLPYKTPASGRLLVQYITSIFTN